MARAAAAITAGFCLASDMAEACVIAPAECPTQRGVAYLQAHGGNVVLFRETLDDLGPNAARVMLVECDSRQGVMVVDETGADPAADAALAYLDGVMADSGTYGLDQILRNLRRLGADASRVRLSVGHCGCDLPAIAPPATYCPQM